jgi:hypothetical protein
MPISIEERSKPKRKYPRIFESEMDIYKTGSFHWEVAYIIPLSIQPDPPVDGVERMITLQTLHLYRYYFQNSFAPYQCWVCSTGGENVRVKFGVKPTRCRASTTLRISYTSETCA